MPDTGEMNSGNIALNADRLGLSAGQMEFVAQTVLGLEFQFGVGMAATIAFSELSPPVAVAIGTVLGWGAGMLADYVLGSAFDGLDRQAQILGAGNFDLSGAMMDPTTGAGYY